MCERPNLILPLGPVTIGLCNINVFCLLVYNRFEGKLNKVEKQKRS